MGPDHRRIAAFALVAGFSLTGCFSEADSPRDMSSAGLNCTTSIDTIAAPPEGYQSVFGVIALPDPGIQHQLGRTDPSSGLRFAKMGLLVKAGEEQALITVDPGQTGEVRIGWGSIAVGDPPSPPPVEQLVVPRCEDDSEWLVYAGGIWVDGPACVGLMVSTGIRSESVRLPIAIDCP
jgi:hypothetical protein